MSLSLSKPMALLEAYEELTRKETHCLGEENWDSMLATQGKKKKLAAGLSQHFGKLNESESGAFKMRVEALEVQEAKNANLLSKKILGNRELYKKLLQDTKSGTKAIRAYGQPDVVPERKNTLVDRA